MGESMNIKEVIVISAVSFRSGGPLSILNDCLNYLSKNLANDYEIIALINNCNFIDKKKISSNIQLIEYPSATKSYIRRLYLEYIFFKKFSQNKNIKLWLSLHDITPNVKAERRAVYCHNPAPFFKPKLKDIAHFKLILFYKLYKIIYRINIKKNNFIIVQQEWLLKEFKEKFKINNIVVAHPNVDPIFIDKNLPEENIFFFPTFPRFFKNIEIICKATEKIIKTNRDFKIIITINGTENSYTKKIVDKFSHIQNIQFIGLISREEVFDLYAKAKCLIFPSRLETWGLPITEFKCTEKIILAVDLPYAHETVGEYKNVSFFPPDSEEKLLHLMLDIIENKFIPEGNSWKKSQDILLIEGWRELFKTLLMDRV